MKKFFLSILSLFLFTFVNAQQINKTMLDPDIERKILIGEIDEDGLRNPVFLEDWDIAQEEYTPDKLTVKKLRKFFRKNKDVRVKVFFASWCGDSKEHVPHFEKLAQKAKIKNVKYIALSRKKSLPDEDISSYEIDYVPTFIIYKDNREIGRIIETPEVSLEKDLYRIISNQ